MVGDKVEQLWVPKQMGNFSIKMFSILQPGTNIPYKVWKYITTSSTRSGIKMVSIFAYASETVDVSALLVLWLEPVEPSSQTVGFLDAFVLARSSFANSRAWDGNKTKELDLYLAPSFETFRIGNENHNFRTAGISIKNLFRIVDYTSSESICANIYMIIVVLKWILYLYYCLRVWITKNLVKLSRQHATGDVNVKMMETRSKPLDVEANSESCNKLSLMDPSNSYLDSANEKIKKNEE